MNSECKDNKKEKRKNLLYDDYPIFNPEFSFDCFTLFSQRLSYRLEGGLASFRRSW